MLGFLKRLLSRKTHGLSDTQCQLLWDGYLSSQSPGSAITGTAQAPPANQLWDYFDSHRKGRGIFKWHHYFDIYHRHLDKFRGRPVNVLEIGVLGGGSLDMWRHYFGAQCRVFGVDIEASCKNYENDGVKVFIGDQADRAFLQDIKRQIPRLDLIIDDGGHELHQQIPTLEELLPHLKEGGVYVCEDVHGAFNGFASYIAGFVHNLNQYVPEYDFQNPERQIASKATQFQSVIHSVHFYPFVIVIEKQEVPIREFMASKHGTQWQPGSQTKACSSQC